MVATLIIDICAPWSSVSTYQPDGGRSNGSSRVGATDSAVFTDPQGADKVGGGCGLGGGFPGVGLEPPPVTSLMMPQRPPEQAGPLAHDGSIAATAPQTRTKRHKRK